MNNPKISIICALSENRVIGQGDRIPWHIKVDLIHFKEKTLHHTIIMGRNTFDSLLGYYQRSGKPMPERNNIIVTRDKNYLKSNGGVSINQLIDALVVNSLDEALQKAKEIEKEEIFISGGEQIFKQTIHLADKLYLTIVNGNFEGDKYFPDYSMFKKVISKEEREEKEQRFTFIELER